MLIRVMSMLIRDKLYEHAHMGFMSMLILVMSMLSRSSEHAHKGYEHAHIGYAHAYMGQL